jgi:hypothetical protein
MLLDRKQILAVCVRNQCTSNMQPGSMFWRSSLNLNEPKWMRKRHCYVQIVYATVSDFECSCRAKME